MRGSEHGNATKKQEKQARRQGGPYAHDKSVCA